MTSPNRPRTTALLDDLLNNPLDPGYQAAARAGKAKKWWEGPAAWLGALAIGFTFVLAYQQSHRAAPATATARKDLISRIRAVQSEGDKVQSQTKALTAQVLALRAADLSGPENAAVTAQEISAGEVAVTGPGIRVSLADPTSTSAPNALGLTSSDLRDTDLRAVVNELWSAGAEAIAVNDVRLTATSAIRVAGESILVDFLPVSSPYTVEAIGPANTLLADFANSAEARALKTKQGVDSISFSVETVSKLRLAAGVANTLNNAELGEAPSGAAPSSPATSGPSTSGPSTIGPSATAAGSPP